MSYYLHHLILPPYTLLSSHILSTYHALSLHPFQPAIMPNPPPSSVDATGLGYSSPNFYSVEKHFWSGKPKIAPSNAHLPEEEREKVDAEMREELKRQGDGIEKKILLREEQVRREKEEKKALERERKERIIGRIRYVFGRGDKGEKEEKGKGKEVVVE